MKCKLSVALTTVSRLAAKTRKPILSVAYVSCHMLTTDVVKYIYTFNSSRAVKYKYHILLFLNQSGIHKMKPFRLRNLLDIDVGSVVSRSLCAHLQIRFRVRLFAYFILSRHQDVFMDFLS